MGRLALKGAGVRETAKPKSGVNREKQNGYDISQKLMLTWLVNEPGIFAGIEGLISPQDFTTPLYHQVAEMLFAQHREGEVNPARILNYFQDGEEQKQVAAVFHTMLPLQTAEEKAQAFRDVVCRLKESSIGWQSDHLAPTDMAGLMKLMEDKKALESLQRGDTPLHISFE